MSSQANISREYPYLVVRWMAAVYGRRKITFTDQGANGFEGETLFIQYPEAFHDGVLQEGAIQAAVEEIKKQVLKHGFRMCLVLSDTKCIFIERDGSANLSPEPPSGGVQLNFELKKE